MKQNPIINLIFSFFFSILADEINSTSFSLKESYNRAFFLPLFFYLIKKALQRILEADINLFVGNYIEK